MQEEAQGSSSMDVIDHIHRCQALVGSDIQFAFQTIIDTREQEVVGFEALVRGIRNEPPALVFSRIPHEQRFLFDQACRIRAMEAAEAFGIDSKLHLNCSEIKPANVELVVATTLHIARRHQLDPANIVMELSNLDAIGNASALETVQSGLAAAGLTTLADNFGQRDANLRPIAGFRPQLLKLAHKLVDGIDDNLASQAMVKAALAFCQQLGIRALASGVERAEEFEWLQSAGVDLFQGYFFAQPGMDAS
ncbi:MAG: EAL domain-containing protein [Wenzhouxiangella sp.]